MKLLIAAFAAAWLLCSGATVFAQNSPPPADNGQNAGQAEAVIDILNSMTPEQRQQIFHAGVSQVGNLTPEQLQQLKAQFDNMPPDQKKQLEAQIMQMIKDSPQLRAEAQQKLQNLTPAQQQTLGGTGQ